jgi:hypothetical protein
MMTTSTTLWLQLQQPLVRALINAAKRARLTSLILRGGGADGVTTERLANVVEELKTLTRDYMREFIMLVKGYPRRVHRPVATTPYMDRCVFGRHVEKERIVNFLLQRAVPERAGRRRRQEGGQDHAGEARVRRRARAGPLRARRVV